MPIQQLFLVVDEQIPFVGILHRTVDGGEHPSLQRETLSARPHVPVAPGPAQPHTILGTRAQPEFPEARRPLDRPHAQRGLGRGRVERHGLEGHVAEPAGVEQLDFRPRHAIGIEALAGLDLQLPTHELLAHPVGARDLDAAHAVDRSGPDRIANGDGRVPAGEVLAHARAQVAAREVGVEDPVDVVAQVRGTSRRRTALPVTQPLAQPALAQRLGIEELDLVDQHARAFVHRDAQDVPPLGVALDHVEADPDLVEALAAVEPTDRLDALLDAVETVPGITEGPVPGGADQAELGAEPLFVEELDTGELELTEPAFVESVVQLVVGEGGRAGRAHDHEEQQARHDGPGRPGAAAVHTAASSRLGSSRQGPGSVIGFPRSLDNEETAPP